MSAHSADTCARLGCHDGRFLSRHHDCECEPDLLACPECEHPLDEHGKSGCMDSDHPGERDNLGFCVCLRPLTELLPPILAAADAAGFQRGVEKLDALRRQQAGE